MLHGTENVDPRMKPIEGNDWQSMVSVRTDSEETEHHDHITEHT